MVENQNSLKSFDIHVLLLFGKGKLLKFQDRQHTRKKNQKQTEDDMMSFSK